MKNGIAEKTPLFYARVAGYSLLLLALIALYANFFVLLELLIPGDAAATVANITANELSFRFAIASFVIVLVLDVIISWALYVLLRRVDKTGALLAMIFRLVYSAILGAAIFNFLSILLLVKEEAYLAELGTNQLQGQVMLLIDGFSNGWVIGLVFFGIHLLLIGYLVFKSGFMPKILGILVMLAGLGYMIDSFAYIILENYDDYEIVFVLIVAIPGAIGELALAIWLLLKGKKIPEMTPVKESCEERVHP
ncbi:hypothetical protein HNQ44_001453 [Planomicrobium koreense]|uniref:DUF4386 domain-containing protein n=1 Tax=Planococcus koreensis TaxID=112331 RepID=A0A7W8CSG6_9BACL|nr:DUF4386 domain-containing protein [Planococcus koreensis]MBB5180029.1 hypothetical protein [Planococcus koreensis]